MSAGSPLVSSGSDLEDGTHSDVDVLRGRLWRSPIVLSIFGSLGFVAGAAVIGETWRRAQFVGAPAMRQVASAVPGVTSPSGVGLVAIAPTQGSQASGTWQQGVQDPTPQQEDDAGFWRHYARDCWSDCGGVAGLCEQWCGYGRACCKFGRADDPAECQGVTFWPALTFHTCVRASNASAASPSQQILAPPSPAPPGTSAGGGEGALPAAPAPVPTPGPTYRFYLYRATGDASFPLGNVNTANVPGVLWYLENEVMQYARCPKRYGINRIRRYIVTTQATPELYARGMNFGIRYSFDHGSCTGSNVRVLGPCSDTWDKYGHVVGCNNFRDHYPWPIVDTEYPDGMWFSFPLDGKCDQPNGTRNCTWGYEEAGEIMLSDLESKEPGHQYCCQGNCTGFWRGHLLRHECDRRLAEVMLSFAAKYPEYPVEMPQPVCDFNRQRFFQ